jgi:hypothetical protein
MLYFKSCGLERGGEILDRTLEIEKTPTAGSAGGEIEEYGRIWLITFVENRIWSWL